MGVVRKDTSNILNRTQLIKLKLKAVRSGVWFKALPRLDRVLFDLTIKVAEKIRSENLAQRIFVIMGKLERLLESKFMRMTRMIGRSLAKEISGIAQRWGNVSAKGWATDASFAVYLATHMQINGAHG